MDVTLARQKHRNLESRNGWDRYASHRKQVMRLLTDPGVGGFDGAVEGVVESATQLRSSDSPDAGPSTPLAETTLCVFGAGNCNDLDLRQLTNHFEEIHLADLDGEALAFGVQQQDFASDDRVHLHGSIDVTGVSDLWSEWSPQSPPSGEALTACIDAARVAPVPNVPSPFHAVASVCLLTQLTDSIALAVGERHPRFPELMQAARNRHLELLVEMTEPGGRICLVTDVVSSVTYPALATVPQESLLNVLIALIQQRNFFTGANPLVIRHFFASHPSVCEQLEDVTMITPWRWDFGPRVYAVTAICARRKRR